MPNSFEYPNSNSSSREKLNGVMLQCNSDYASALATLVFVWKNSVPASGNLYDFSASSWCLGHFHAWFTKNYQFEMSLFLISWKEGQRTYNSLVHNHLEIIPQTIANAYICTFTLNSNAYCPFNANSAETSLKVYLLILFKENVHILANLSKTVYS